MTVAGRFARRADAHPLSSVFVLALLVRLVNVALLRGNESFFAESDAFEYWAMGAALAKPGGFWPGLVAMTDRMPLYPLLLAGVRSAFGEAPRIVALVQAVIDAGTCTLIAALGALLSPAIGWTAGILAALSLTLIVFGSQILTDTLFLFFFTLTLLAGAHFLRRPSRWLALLAGFAGGLALAARPTITVLLAAGVPLVLVVALAHRRGLAAALAATALFTLGAAAPIAPTWLRNVVQYGSVGLTTQAGEHLASFIVPLVTQRANGTPYQTTVDRMGALYRQRVAERGLGTETNPFRLAALKSELAREEMARLPLGAYVKAWLEGMVVNLGAPALTGDPRMRALPKPSFYNTPGASLWDKARAYLLDDPGWYQVLLIAGIIGMLPFLVLEAVGFVMLARMQPWAAVFAAGVLAYFLLLSGPVATPKYRLPMEPVLIVLAAIPLARTVEWLSANRSTERS